MNTVLRLDQYRWYLTHATESTGYAKRAIDRGRPADARYWAAEAVRYGRAALRHGRALQRLQSIRDAQAVRS